MQEVAENQFQEPKEQTRWNFSKLCAHCSNPKCMGYTEDEAHQGKGCRTLFWLAVGEYSLERAVKARKKIEDRLFSKEF